MPTQTLPPQLSKPRGTGPWPVLTGHGPVLLTPTRPSNPAPTATGPPDLSPDTSPARLPVPPAPLAFSPAPPVCRSASHTTHTQTHKCPSGRRPVCPPAARAPCRPVFPSPFPGALASDRFRPEPSAPARNPAA